MMKHSIHVSFLITICSMHLLHSAEKTKERTAEQQCDREDLEQEFEDLKNLPFDEFLKRDHAKRLRRLVRNNLQLLQELTELERQHPQDQAAAMVTEQMQQSLDQKQYTDSTPQQQELQEKYDQKQTIIKKIIGGKPLTPQEAVAFTTLFSIEQQMYLLELQKTQTPQCPRPASAGSLYPTDEELNSINDLFRPEPQAAPQTASIPSTKIEYPWHDLYQLQSEADFLDMQKRDEHLKIKNFFIHYLAEIDKKNIDRKHLINKKIAYHFVHEQVLKRQHYSAQEIQTIKDYLQTLDDTDYRTLLALAYMKNRSLDGILVEYIRHSQNLIIDALSTDIIVFYIKKYPNQYTDYSRYNESDAHYLQKQEQKAHELINPSWKQKLRNILTS